MRTAYLYKSGRILNKLRHNKNDPILISFVYCLPEALNAIHKSYTAT